MQMAANRIAIVVTSFAKLRENALVVFSVLLCYTPFLNRVFDKLVLISLAFQTQLMQFFIEL